jgi:hypothetical protein
LIRIFCHEGSSHVADDLRASKAGRQSKLGSSTEPFFEAGHYGQVRSSEAVNRLPVVTNDKQKSSRLLDESANQASASLARILELVNHYQVKRKFRSPRLKVVGRLDQHVLEVDTVFFGK